MRILITRPADDAAPLAQKLHAMGIETQAEPMLSIRYLTDIQPELSGVQAVLITSANGARALAKAMTDKASRRELAVFAVGESSARAARDLGFGPVESASGDVGALAALVVDRLQPAGGALLHVAGSHLAGDLAARIEDAGFACRRCVLYESDKATAISKATADLIRGGEIDGVLLFSPRTAAAFTALAARAGLNSALAGIVAYCLSAAVAEKASLAAWRKVVVADRPDLASLLKELEPDD